MPSRKRKKTRKVTKFRKIEFKLSQNQYRSLMNYCKARKITPIKLIKKSISRFTSGYELHVPPQYFISEKQLELFKEPDDQD
ncbi:MAG: hypothetical protein WCR58_03845 [Bacteroidales bacterium]|jgi:hypothetical protein|nr:hypothetical protein [Bacteroidales bacterium]MCK9447924.1 hypothetical protein [Bacteroidales bacterium]MDD3701130.1 hypothetical protein [Bacteroidales bacterium]MDY0368577.1 hypothetical protein [Bacteroidales bacterium]